MRIVCFVKPMVGRTWVMKISVAVAVVMGFFLAVGTHANAAVATNAMRYYVQLIRTSDTTNAPVAGAQLVGPKLTEKFHAVFKGRTYWETKCQEVLVAPGRPVKVSLTSHRDVEIGVTDANRTIKLFYNGEVVNRITAARGEGMSIIGDTRKTEATCFVVVRRDKPTRGE
jgi:hypothetical protein